MPNIIDFLNDSKTFGYVRATVIEDPIKRDAKGWQITDLKLSDGSGTITISIFNENQGIQRGDLLNITKCYVKEFRGVAQLATRKDSVIEIVSRGNQTSLNDSPSPQQKSSGTQVSNQNKPQSAETFFKETKDMADVVRAIEKLGIDLKTEIIELKVALLGQLQINAGIKPAEAKKNGS